MIQSHFLHSSELEGTKKTNDPWLSSLTYDFLKSPGLLTLYKLQEKLKYSLVKSFLKTEILD